MCHLGHAAGTKRDADTYLFTEIKKRYDANMANSLAAAAFDARRNVMATGVIALIVPFRQQAEQNRAAQLRRFLEHFGRFLRSAGRDTLQFLIIVVEQSDDGRPFNRGQLLNVGYREAQKLAEPRELASVVLHDVDLLPTPGLLRWYVQPPSRGLPTHIAGPSTWRKYAQKEYAHRFFGGVTAVHPSDFEAANGYPNHYWGWGKEDDQLRLRFDAIGALAGGVVRPPEGAGRYEDTDEVSMNSSLTSRESILAKAHLFNQCAPLGGRQLDENWKSAQGLHATSYDVLTRTEGSLAARVRTLHVLARLTSPAGC
jgi:hypothetical protein